MSGTQSRWWEAAPLASEAPRPRPTDVLTTGNRWWEAAPLADAGTAPELAPELGGIVDDPQYAAPKAALASASMFPNVEDRIPVLAKALNIPVDRFATMNGQVLYQLPDGRYARAEPSVVGTRGGFDLAKRLGGYAAGSVGPAIPAAASIAAGAATGGVMAPVLAAGAAGGVGDIVRQGIGNLMQGKDASGIDWWNVAGQAALGAGGQAIGTGIQKGFEAVPHGLAAADRAWMRNPANVAEARANADLLRNQGITAMSGAVTGRGSLLAADRQLRRNVGTADAVGGVVRRINTEEVPAAIERSAGQIYPNEGVDVTARKFQDAAKQVIESPRLEVNANSREAYRLAQAEPDQWNAAFRRILENREMQELYRAAAVRAERDVTTGRPGAVSLPPLEAVGKTPPPVQPSPFLPQGGAQIQPPKPVTPPFEAWQYMRRELDARAEKAKTDRDFNSARQFGRLSDMLDGAIRQVNPNYVIAQEINRPGQQITARLNEGVLGSVAKTNPDAPPHQVLAKAFSPSMTTPAAIAESRQAFVNAGQVDAWDSAFSAYVRSVADTAGKTLVSGEPGNVPGLIHKELFGTNAKRRAVAAALGGDDTPAYRQFAETMRAMEIAGRTLPMGSQTATDMGKIGAAASPSANLAAFALRAANVPKWPQWLANTAERIEESSASKAAQRVADTYLKGPQVNGALLETMRLMNPAAVGLLAGAGRGGTGLLGMLLDSRDNGRLEPYQPPLRR